MVASSVYCALALLLVAAPGRAKPAPRFEELLPPRYVDIDSWSRVRRGRELERLRDIAGAQEEYLAAVDSHCPGAAALAALSLGDLLARLGDPGSARDAYQEVIQIDWHPLVTAAARRQARRLVRQTRMAALLAYIGNRDQPGAAGLELRTDRPR